MLNKIKVGLPLQLVIVVGMALLLGDLLPVQAVSVAYALSLSIKELLLFVMPFIIFSFIFSCLVSFREGTLKFLFALLGSICLSNFISTMIAFSISLSAIQLLHQFSIPTLEMQSSLVPAWNLTLYKIIPNDVALFGGVLLGLVCSFLNAERVEKVSQNLKIVAHTILNKLFVPILPIFILGFVLKMQYEGVLITALVAYAPIVLVFFVTQVVYLSLLYGIGVGFNFTKWVCALKNVLPAAVTALSTMSSLAAMPYTLKAAQKNTNGNHVVDVVVPATVNVHLVGDSIAIPTIALAILFSMGMPMPSLSLYLVFAFYFVVNKFAVAAVPGGGILVMLPVLQQYLQFNDEMLSLITMLYIFFDAIITMVNVVGNGAFAILFPKFYRSKKVVEGELQENSHSQRKAA